MGPRAPLNTYYVTHMKSISFKVDVWDLSSYLEQELPGCGDLASILGDPLQISLTTIDYYPDINTPIIDNKAA